MFKLAGTELGKLCSGYQRQDDVGGESFFYGGFDAEGMRCINEDAGVLRRDDGIDDGGKIVYVGESLYAQDDVVKGTIANV